MLFRPVTYEDLDEIRDLQPEDWSDIIPDFRFYIESPCCYPAKIIMNGRITGVGASIVFKNTAWLAHIIVDIRYRRQGIGSYIVQELLKICENEPIETFSLIATESGKPVYEKAGFRVVTKYAFLQRENLWKPKVVSSNVVPFREDYRPGIYKLDMEISGENRTGILRHFLKNSLVYELNKEVLGFYIPDLRDGVIYANTVEAGLELMKVKYAVTDKASLPSTNDPAISFLKENGFAVTGKKGTRMILGKEINWKPDKIYSRVGGNMG